MHFLFFAVVVLIAYGSLYPFDFSAAGPDAIERLFTDWTFFSGRGDVFGNIVLFVPYGLTGILAMPPVRPFAGRLGALSLFGLFFATLLQAGQLFLPARDPEMGDVIWNLAGMVVGAYAAKPRSVRELLASGGGLDAARAIPLVLVGCWLVAELSPFVPSIDFQSVKESLKPLLVHPAFAVSTFLRETVTWLIVAYLGTGFVRLLPPGAWRSNRLWLPVAMAGFLLAKTVIVRNAVTVSDVAAIAVALPAWFLVARLDDRVPRFLLALLCIAVFLDALSPFTIQGETRSFMWVPFSGALTGSMLLNAKAVAGKLFVIGSLFYLCLRYGYRPASVTLLAAGFFGTLEIAQLWIGSHTPEITDPLVALLAGAFFMTVGDRAVATEPAAPRGPAGARAPAAGDAAEASRHEPNLRGPGAPEPVPGLSGSGAVLLVVGIGAIAVCVNAVLGLPGVPYNVRELFGGDDAWWKLLFFALAVLSLGMGGALAGRYSATQRLPLLRLPAAAITACLASYVLLSVAVTGESIADIAGSANTYYYVMRENLWGDIGRQAFAAIGSEGLISTVERAIRFVALSGPLFLWMAVVVGSYWPRAALGRSGATPRKALMHLVILVLSALPWLYLFRVIAFTRSSTDNLNELIQDNGAMLYPLLVLLPATALAVAHAARTLRPGTIVLAIAVLALSLPAGWFFLTGGLAEEVHKYGRVFSGVDFLLGPNRDELLPRSTLMLRWFGVQTVLVLACAYGMRIALPPTRTRRVPAHDD